ncbi:PAS domain-containing protein [uncultured Roseibium sp.]|uniref:PAS domain-containing protein n=2 Tax=uncultured Roseibium sp. TaxID=1936171 RepID=UPI0026224816|nr:PAS domain-containing protein [uncultured Roseibium sp.]
MAKDAIVTGVEQFFGDDEIIVSKTDLKGKITYCNDVFLRIAGYTEKECLGEPHNIIRHPDMPRCVFDLLWGHIQDRREIFAYVVNRCKNGDHYWVLAHVTPSVDNNGDVVGYHSNRRVPDRSILEGVVVPLYADLVAEERRHANRKDGLQSSKEMVSGILQERGVPYDEFIAGL